MLARHILEVVHMKETDQIPEYVFAYLHGRASEEQNKLTQIWLKQADNHSFYDQIKKTGQLLDDLKRLEKFNLQEGKIAVRNRIRKSRKIKWIGSIQKIAALMLLPALLFTAWFYFQNVKLKTEMTSAQVIQEIKTQPGIRSHFSLPDGTGVWLNSASTIKFPSVFSGENRLVELDGEAYFEVFKNKAKPFIVRSGALEVVALGTAFNLCAYSDDNKTSATLAEGKLKIITREGKKKQFILEPDEQLNLEKDILLVSKTQVNVYNIIAWKDGKLIFNETPFSEVVRKLGRWFNTDITLADKSIANYRYTATFTNETLSQVLELLTFSAPIEFTSTNRKAQQNNNFSREQIIIRVNPDALQDTNKKNKMPVK